MTFRAILIERTDAAQTVEVQTLSDERLPTGDVTVEIE
jgi:hypothetical protein